jgi:hypothetical protein
MSVYIEDLQATTIKEYLEDTRRQTPEGGAHLVAGQGDRPGG